MKKISTSNSISLLVICVLFFSILAIENSYNKYRAESTAQIKALEEQNRDLSNELAAKNATFKNTN